MGATRITWAIQIQETNVFVEVLIPQNAHRNSQTHSRNVWDIPFCAECKGGTWEWALEACKALSRKYTSTRHIVIVDPRFRVHFVASTGNIHFQSHMLVAQNMSRITSNVNTHCFSVFWAYHTDYRSVTSRLEWPSHSRACLSFFVKNASSSLDMQPLRVTLSLESAESTIPLRFSRRCATTLSCCVESVRITDGRAVA